MKDRTYTGNKMFASPQKNRSGAGDGFDRITCQLSYKAKKELISLLCKDLGKAEIESLEDPVQLTPLIKSIQSELDGKFSQD